MEFIFSLTNYHSTLFLPQISRVLEKITEMSSRKRFPRIWKYIDKMRVKRKKGKSKQTLLKYKISGFLYLFVGIFLIAIVFGFWLIKNDGTSTERPLFKKEILLKKERRTPYTKAADKFLETYENVESESIQFSENVISFSKEPNIKYEEIDEVFVTTDFYVILWNERIVVLQKKDLKSSSEEAFLDFLSSKIQKSYHEMIV
ncbi:hypothetical protein [Anaerotignum sp.]|uniref:hypothetical protein n=1 Tax=Anaerotignum sp. TaxID=2039241 RepID=UPI002897AE8A|nr:hypothetical protein [Anaerotignum sp.]